MSLWVLLGVSRVHAASLSEREFWLRMEQTRDQLQRAIQQQGAARTATLTQITDLWKEIDSVRLSDQTEIAVDVQWLQSDLPSENSGLQAYRDRVQTLLTYRSKATIADTNTELDALAKVLEDPRFRYPEESSPRLPDVSISPELARLALIIAVVIATVIAAYYLVRGLSDQRVRLDGPAAMTDDPTTSDMARERAAASEAASDYRNAVRYLYLSSLLMLDERGLIHYDRTLTNREHLRQVAEKAQVAEALRPVVNTFDDVWYGFAPINELLYQQFRQDVDRLRQLTP
jgi:hypothetical protein